MQLKKKALSIAITSMLLLAIVMAAAPFAHAAPVVTLSVATGPVGTKVTVSGTGATAFGTDTFYWDSLSGAVLNATGVDSTGAFTAIAIIPSAINGGHFIVVADAAGNTGTAFTVTSSLKASTTPPTIPTKVLPGDALTLKGDGFSGTQAVTITFVNGTGSIFAVAAPGLTTNATGSFSQVVLVPTVALSTSQYIVNATDALGVIATANVTVNYYVAVKPGSGPPGITVTISGRGPTNTALTLTIDTVSIATFTSSNTTGAFSVPYTLPALIGAGGHIIGLYQGVTLIATAALTVTPPPSPPVLSAASGIAGTVITMTNGTIPYDASANITLTFGTTVVNSTATDSRFGPTDANGAFSVVFSVPALAPGVYTLTVADQFGATASLTGGFTILAAPATTVALRGTTYAQGDTISFNIFTTEANLGTPNQVTVTVMDPTKMVFWTAVWPVTGPAADGSSQVLYQDQVSPPPSNSHLTLPIDAKTGSWNWTITYTPASTATLTTATGLFTVIPGGVGGVVASVNGLNATLTAIQGSITTINNGVATIQSTVGGLSGGLSTVTSSVSSLSAQITSITGSVATLSTNMGTLTTAVNNLNATLTGINGNVATVQTSVGTLQGTITTIQGNVATVQTNVGALQASLGTLQSSVNAVQSSVKSLPTDVPAKADVTGLSTIVWIAVIFAIIAAIAAIASIVIVRQKVAG